MARRKAVSDHRPIPVSGSGVMLEEKMAQNGVGTGSPPAKFLAPRTVWQSLQLPIAARSRPRFTSAASNACGADGSIAAITGRQAIAKAATAPATSAITMTLAMIRDGPVMRFRWSSLSLDDALTQTFCRRSPARRRLPHIEVPFYCAREAPRPRAALSFDA